MDQGVLVRLPGVQRLLQHIQHEVCLHAVADAQATM